MNKLRILAFITAAAFFANTAVAIVIQATYRLGRTAWRASAFRALGLIVHGAFPGAAAGGALAAILVASFSWWWFRLLRRMV